MLLLIPSPDLIPENDLAVSGSLTCLALGTDLCPGHIAEVGTCYVIPWHPAVLWDVRSEGHAGALADDTEPWVRGALLSAESLPVQPQACLCCLVWSARGSFPLARADMEKSWPSMHWAQGVANPQFCSTGSNPFPK